MVWKWFLFHDDVIKWKHFPRYWPFVWGIHRSTVNSPHKGQWRGALMFSLIYVWINGWVNNCEAGDLRRYRAHYDVTVICINGKSLISYNLTTCKTFGVLQFWLRALSIWLLVPIALEIFIAVWFPFRTIHLNTKGRYVWFILGLSIILFAVYAPLCENFIHFHKMTDGQIIGYCHLLGDGSEHFMWYRMIFDYMNLMVSSLLPFLYITVFILVLNTANICGLVKSRTHLPEYFHKAHSEMRRCAIALEGWF